MACSSVLSTVQLNTSALPLFIIKAARYWESTKPALASDHRIFPRVVMLQQVDQEEKRKGKEGAPLERLKVLHKRWGLRGERGEEEQVGKGSTQGTPVQFLGRGSP